MRQLVLIVLGLLFAVVMFEIYLIYSQSLQHEKAQEYQNLSPILVKYANNTLYIYNREGLFIERVESYDKNLTIGSSNHTIEVGWESCPLALRIYTNKGLYKTYYIECT
ncbi:MAG: hypothetical protein GXN92_00155 [Candidatus Micrarchaeota archaeon]|nr:hypothetical protein [Candidatus Micrarchaeota archaeon]